MEQMAIGRSQQHRAIPMQPKMAWATPILFLLPTFTFLIVFTYLPAGVSLVLGFYHYHLLGLTSSPRLKPGDS